MVKRISQRARPGRGLESEINDHQGWHGGAYPPKAEELGRESRRVRCADRCNFDKCLSP